MRNANVKYGGIIVAIIGFFILAFLGANYAWDEARNFTEIDMSDYTVHAVIGAILLIGGILTFAFVEE